MTLTYQNKPYQQNNNEASTTYLLNRTWQNHTTKKTKEKRIYIIYELVSFKAQIFTLQRAFTLSTMIAQYIEKFLNF